MRKYFLGLGIVISTVFFLLVSGFKSNTHPSLMVTPALAIPTPEQNYREHIGSLYNTLNLKALGLSLPVFEKAVTGFYNLKQAGKVTGKQILSIADFDQLSTNKRFYIIDLANNQVLLNTWVAHGQNSGGNEANNFSNVNNSFASSLGFYVTGEVYRGSHGKSLKLDGMDEGFNSNARSRSIVVHGADYVSSGTINALGRLGRSQGCPAVSPTVTNQVIDAMENNTVLFINKSVENYKSKYLDVALAANMLTDLTSATAMN